VSVKDSIEIVIYEFELFLFVSPQTWYSFKREMKYLIKCGKWSHWVEEPLMSILENLKGKNSEELFKTKVMLLQVWSINDSEFKKKNISICCTSLPFTLPFPLVWLLLTYLFYFFDSILFDFYFFLLPLFP
jgi:hypothetical protein